MVSRADLNLARNPFLNSRPIGRLAALLWILGGALLVFNVILYWGYFTSSEDRRGELIEAQARIDETEAAIATLQSELQGLRLPRQNAQIAFLNRKIAERTFGWSRLFDDLEDVLPNDVRLVSLSPKTPDDEGSRRAGARKRVLLGIDCMARDLEAELEFIDRLYADPAFGNPRLSADSTDEAGLVRFNLSVVYYPDHATEDAGKTGETGEPEEIGENDEAGDEDDPSAPAPGIRPEGIPDEEGEET